MQDSREPAYLRDEPMPSGRGTHPTYRFLVAHPAHMLALGFGSGLIRFAPGTWGTLVAIPIAEVLWRTGSDLAFLAVVALLVVLGALAADRTARDLGVEDHGSIVVDEIAAFLLVLFFVGPALLPIGVAFLVFRFFDIVKPPPIRAVDERVTNGWGVMADDLLAAGYTLLVLAIAVRVLGWPA